jgi:hypothetical protein
MPGPDWAIAPKKIESSIFHIVIAKLFLNWNNGLKIPTSWVITQRILVNI